MKQITLLLTFFIGLSAGAQEVARINMVPSSPDDNDTIRFYIYLDFPYSGCEGFAVASSSGSDILASSSRCMGFLPTLCNDVDTVVVLPKPAGTYNFIYSLSAGFGGPPCSPSFVPNDDDTLVFTVSSTVAVSEIDVNAHVKIYPNPALSGQAIKIELTQQDDGIMLFDAFGKFLGTFLGNQIVLQLSAGLYHLRHSQTGLTKRLVVINV